MDEGGGRHGLVLRALVAALGSLAAGLAATRLQMRLLDVALYAVLTPIAALTLLVAVPGARRAVRLVQDSPATLSVVPERHPSDGDPVEPSLAEPELTVARARERLVAAGCAGGDPEELLALSAALHDAALELARARLAAGGEVDQELRDEIELQDRVEQVEPRSRVV